MDAFLDFTGKNILITGSTGGIGSKTAEFFAERGASVYIHGQEPDITERMAQKVKRTPFVFDLSRHEGGTIAD